MIAYLQRAQHTIGLLTRQLGMGARGGHINPRVIDGDCHGDPAELLARHDALPYLAQALDAPVERLGPRAPQRQVWFCQVHSDPRHPDLTDAQWAGVARRMVEATGIAPPGDPDACRWIALRNQDRQVVIVATLVREDCGIHNPYRDAFRLQQECQRVAAELGHLPLSPNKPTTAAPALEHLMPVTICAEPSGSVAARGGDRLAKTLLNHAGFAFANDRHGPRHRLPASMSHEEQAAIASHAAQMLRAARYTVELDPALDTAPANPQRAHSLGNQVLALTDQIRGCATGAELADAVAPLLHAEHGVLERVREALEAAGEQITDLDDEAYQLGDRFGFAAEFVSSGQSELLGADEELRRAAVPSQERATAWSPAVHDARSAALATSPAATQASAARNTSPSAPAAAPPAGPARDSASRTR